MGICLRVDQAKDNYETLAGRKLTVVFTDPNGKEIAKAEHQCNDYGSFSGSFTAPRDRLMGRMNINVPNGPFGQASFNVETSVRSSRSSRSTENRCKTQRLVSPRAKQKLHGRGGDGALVKYRVVREVRWPYWWGWYSWRAPRVQGSRNHPRHRAHETDGTFKIEFAAARPSVSGRTKPPSAQHQRRCHRYDRRTRSAQRGVNVGFAALQASHPTSGRRKPNPSP
jgi:hypothetical protein